MYIEAPNAIFTLYLNLYVLEFLKFLCVMLEFTNFSLLSCDVIMFHSVGATMGTCPKLLMCSRVKLQACLVCASKTMCTQLQALKPSTAGVRPKHALERERCGQKSKSLLHKLFVSHGAKHKTQI